MAANGGLIAAKGRIWGVERGAGHSLEGRSGL